MLLGDSIVCLWPTHLLPVDMKKRGIPCDTTKGVLDRLWLVLDEAPDQLFILIGTNNFEYGNIYEAPGDVAQIIKRVTEALPETDVFLLSILPTSEENKSNDVIERINANYELVCNTFPSCTYVDLYSHLYLPGVGFPQSDDGLHPTQEGYSVISSILSYYW